MIHRFVDLLEEIIVDHAMIWNVRQASGGTDRLFALGVPGSTLAEYLDQSRRNTNQWTLDRPVLSPDLSEYVYQEIDSGAAGTNRTRLRLCASDDTTVPVTLAEIPSAGVAISGRPMTIIGWSPDGQYVYWQGQTTGSTSSPSEIRRINRDGTGDTQLWTDAGFLNGIQGFYPRISPDGTMIAMWVDFGGGSKAGMWVMNEDGTNMTQIYACPDDGGEEPDDLYGWSPDSEWLLFRDTFWTPSPREEGIYKIRPDGSDLTTLALPRIGVDPPIYMSQGQYSLWLSDASAIVCAKDNGSGSREVGLLLTDGSETFTPLSPTRTVTNGTYYSDGPVLNDNYRRIYWYRGSGVVGDLQVVSAKIDGSDYRVDDDMDTDPVHDDYLAIGFYKRSI